MLNNDWGSAAPDLKEDRFAGALKKAATVSQIGRPPRDRILTVDFDFEHDGVDPPVLDCGF